LPHEIHAALTEKGSDWWHQSPHTSSAVCHTSGTTGVWHRGFNGRPDLPPQRQAQPSAMVVALYGFGDASGTGFGTTILMDNTIHYRHGKWSTPQSECSSNYRELSNLVFGLEDACESDVLQDCELFHFTDNGTAEAAFNKGMSSSKPLFQLILCLQQLEMHKKMFLHVTHVAKRWMQSQHMNGPSRGCLYSGVLSEKDKLFFIPLHLSAVECQASLMGQVGHWFSDLLHSRLNPFEWFNLRHQARYCLVYLLHIGENY